MYESDNAVDKYVRHSHEHPSAVNVNQALVEVSCFTCAEWRRIQLTNVKSIARLLLCGCKIALTPTADALRLILSGIDIGIESEFDPAQRLG
jgi:hypothetical protein